MFVTTTFDIEGYRITEYKGLVRGITVRSPTIAQGLLGGLKTIIDYYRRVFGHAPEYFKELEACIRQHSYA